MVDFQILLDSQQQFYFPGSTITGYVFIKCSKPINARNVVVGVCGYSNVKWKKRRCRSTTNIMRGRRRIVTYKSGIKILDQQINVWERQGDEKFPEGKKRFYFSFQLPFGLPPTFNVKYGKVYYKLEAKIDVPMRFDKKVESEFKVAPFCDLNSLPGATYPIQQNIHRSYGLISSDEIDITARLNKSAYSINEQVKCIINIQNPSNRHIKSIKLYLMRTIVCKVKKRNKFQTEKLASRKMHIQKNEQQANYTVLLDVPQTMSSFSTPNIVARFCIDGTIWDSNVDVFVPIHIGTVAARSLRVD